MKKGLGTDFSALIPDDMLSEALAVGKSADNVENVDTDLIQPDPKQPRKHFDEESLNELAASIKQHGIVQPLILAKSGSNYLIIAGERRWRAANKIELKTVPAIIRSYGEQEKIEISLIENVQREDLTLLDLAATYLRLREEFNLSYEVISNRVGKSQSAVANIARLMKLPLAAKKALHEKKIVEGHARQIIALTDDKDQLELLELILKHKWTVRQAEQFVVGKKQEKTSNQPDNHSLKRTMSETKETKQLAKRLGTKVTVKHMAHGGRLVIDFKDEKHLVKLINDLL